MWFSSNQWSESKETCFTLFESVGPESKKTKNKKQNERFWDLVPIPVATQAQD